MQILAASLIAVFVAASFAQAQVTSILKGTKKDDEFRVVVPVGAADVAAFGTTEYGNYAGDDNVVYFSAGASGELNQFGFAEDSYVHDADTSGDGTLYAVGSIEEDPQKEIPAGWLRKSGLDGSSPTTVFFTDFPKQSLRAVSVMPNGDIVAAGTYEDEDSRERDGFLIFLTPDLSIKKRFVFGEAGDDDVHDIAVTSGGDVLVVGSAIEASGDMEGLLVRYNGGKEVDLRTIGGRNEQAFYSIVDLGEQWAIAGKTHDTPTGNADAWLALVSRELELKMAKPYGSKEAEQFNGITATSGGALILCGQTDQKRRNGWDGYVMVTNLSGEELSRQIVGGGKDDRFSSVIYLPEAGEAGGRIVLAGSNESDAIFGRADAWVLEVDGDLLLNQE